MPLPRLYSELWGQFLLEFHIDFDYRSDGTFEGVLEDILGEYPALEVEQIAEELEARLNDGSTHQELWEFWDVNKTNLYFDTRTIRMFFLALLDAIRCFQQTGQIERKSFDRQMYQHWLELKDAGGPEAELEIKAEDLEC